MYFVCAIQKKSDGTYANSMSSYETLDAAKVKAYTELAYGFGSDLELCSVCIMDDTMMEVYRDCYIRHATEAATA